MNLADYTQGAANWLKENARPLESVTDEVRWGEGSDEITVFHDVTDEEEQQLLDEAMAWQRAKYDAGYGAIAWPSDLGGAGLPEDYARAFDELEAEYDVPGHHETFSVTLRLIAPTIAQFGQDELQRDLLPHLLRMDTLICQLFSEPGAGSDLAALNTRAERDGDEWVLSGQKIWSSGARFSEYGMVVARHDFTAPKHTGMTAFIMRMDAPGVEIRPIRQMSGGSSFNEVFFDGARIPDAYRLGEVGEGWKVALTTLGFERSSSGSDRGSSSVGASFAQLLELARWLDRTDDATVRQQLADVYIHDRIRDFIAERAATSARGSETPGPEASLGKLLWTQSMTRIADVAAELLGARLTADTGEWGTFSWNGQLLGAPGYRIAGGSDEIQRNILGERVLGLPSEPRVDKGVAFRDIPR